MDTIPEPVLRIKQIFEDYYGEDKVDLVQTVAGSFFYDFIIWFPEVKVTNERDESVIIKDVYVKISVNGTGKLSTYPTMTRGTFTEAQYRSHYIHSHCSGSFPYNPDEYFRLCFGTGPIVRTLASLFAGFDDALWTLFCGELDLYVHTESIVGVPYKRLSSIGAGYADFLNAQYRTSMDFYPSRGGMAYCNSFIKYLLDNYDIPIVYKNGTYKIAMSTVELFLFISNAALEYERNYPAINEFTFHDSILKDGKLYKELASGALPDSTSYITFKGEQRPVRITNSSGSQYVTLKILDNIYVSIIVSKILNLINFKYGKEERTECAL